MPYIMYMKDFIIHNVNLIFIQKIYRPESHTDLNEILFCFFLHVFNWLASIHMWLYTYDVHRDSVFSYLGIGIPASDFSVRYRSIPVPDWVPLFRYQIGSVICILFHPGTAHRILRRSGIYKNSAKVEIFTQYRSILLVVKRHHAHSAQSSVHTAGGIETPYKSILLVA